MSKRRRRRSFGFRLVGLVILGALLYAGYLVSADLFGWARYEILEYLHSSKGQMVVGIFGACVLAVVILRIRYALARMIAIGQLSPDTDRESYLIEPEDYRRGNAKENLYRKVFSLHLLDTFDNCCAKCGSKENGIDFDHFIFSKNEGGSFIMRHVDGHLVNNAIPLCRTCNRKKSDQNYREFFRRSELATIFERSLVMTKKLNERPLLDASGDVLRQRKGA